MGAALICLSPPCALVLMFWGLLLPLLLSLLAGLLSLLASCATACLLSLLLSLSLALSPRPPLAPLCLLLPLGRVFAAEAYIGRISIIKPGTRQEALSVYCSRHGCTVCKSTRAAPGHDEVLAWFVQGLALPKGRTPAFKRRHLDLFPRP